MRKILIILAALLVSCESSLDLEPKMFIPADEAFSNRENVYAALIGCYDALQQQHYYGRNLVIVGDLASDNSRASGSRIEYYSTDENSLLADNLLVEGIWEEIYGAVNRVNYMLYKLGEADFLDPVEKNDFEGQLKFLRALHYFNLVRLYGGVPLKTSPTLAADEAHYLPRASAGEVCDQLVTDLKDAAKLITNTGTEMATAPAAGALLSLVYLTMKEHTLARDLARAVFDEVNYLEVNYAELFSVRGEPSREILFYVGFNPNDNNRLAEYHFPNKLGGRYENAPTVSLVEAIEPGDRRRELVAARYADQYYTTKYPDLNTGGSSVLVLRTAELLFIEAEAAYGLDSVANSGLILDNINTIRHRAGIDSVMSVPPGQLWNLLDRERRVEFAFEGKRWFDLIRNGLAIGVVPTVTSPEQMLFPIPLSEILANPSISMDDQNPGY